MPSLRLNVRCCCTPTKILGTLEVPPGAVERRGFLVHTMRPAAPWNWQELLDAGQSLLRANTEHVEIRSFGYLGEPAIYSEERPVEFWRGLPTFREGDEVRW